MRLRAEPRPRASASSASPAQIDAAVAQALARRALANIRREYPNHPQYLLERVADVVAPSALHPCFYGCFDWHSAVHTHWLLVRLLNTLPDFALRAATVAALSASFTPAKVRVEARYLAKHRTFERPYGLAWLALLGAEVRACAAPAARAWSLALEPLVAAERANTLAWLGSLRYPVRSGTHNQTAFALGLLHDAARSTGDDAVRAVVRRAALRFYRADTDAPLRYEPSGEDFLSPSLMEADLMRRVLGTRAFATWLDRFLPAIPARDSGWLACGEVADETDGKLVHLHGLNLSRAWNLENIAASLPTADSRADVLRAAARRHRRAGVAAALAASDYAGDHWLPTFAVYLLTGAGSPSVGADRSPATARARRAESRVSSR
jgi:hypothetical protein